MKILVTGASGQLAQELAKASPGVECWGRDRLDLSATASIADALRGEDFDLLVNAAAYTAVDKAETEPEAAKALNTDAPRILAELTARKGVPIIHISTDYVFDGTKSGAYAPDDATGPQGVYGQTKLDGERAVAAQNPRHVTLRTAWVYSSFGANFVKTMLRLADRDELGVVDDQRGCPTSAADLAAAIIEMAPQSSAADASAPFWGMHHFAGRGTCTWADFADAIFDQAHALGLIDQKPKVNRITTAEYPTPAKRPLNSALDCSSFDQNFTFNRPEWRDSLQEVLTILADHRGM